MKALVTGSSGMIGKEVVRQLHERRIETIEFSIAQGLDIGKLGQLQKLPIRRLQFILLSHLFCTAILPRIYV